MDPRLKEIAEAVAGDSHSGASEMLANAALSILSLSDDHMASVPPSEWTEFGIRLHLAKPSIATLFNLANVIMLEAERPEGYRRVRRAVEDMLEQEDRSVKAISEIAAGTIAADWIVTSSYSSTVGAVLGSIASLRPLRVTVAESLPGGEGRLFAKKLWDMGIRTEVVPDSNLFARMGGADCALTGADSVAPQGLVNKVGTRSLVEAACCHGRPAYAVCGHSKFSPVPLPDMVVTEGRMSDGPQERTQLFEYTPLERFTYVITEEGAFTPDRLREILRGRRLSSAWSPIGLGRAIDLS